MRQITGGGIAVISDGLKDYEKNFDTYLALNNRKLSALDEMVKQGREVEELSDQIRNDQKKELQQLEKAATSDVNNMRNKREKADDANRMIKLTDEASKLV